MAGLSPTPETTLVIILGASEFPKIKSFDPNPAFADSARDFRRYLLAKAGFALPSANLLDLFDASDSTADIDEQVADFLQARSQSLKRADKKPLDVLVYYVGHGGFVNDGGSRDYFLTLASTRDT